MSGVDYTKLDRWEISMGSFYPRRNWTPTPTGCQDYMLPVEPEVGLSARFHPAGLESPTILFFYGNGETACDYDDIAPLYNQIGVNFLAADYRGYGRSGGSPSFSTMLSDSVEVLKQAKRMLEGGGYRGELFVMGRSMGRHAAFELAAGELAGGSGTGLAGVIVESGRPTLGQFTRGLAPEEAKRFAEAYREKVRSISLPLLVIHGEVDTLAPVEEARAMYEEASSENKKMVTIPGAGHNDLLYQGMGKYFYAIQEFVSTGWRAG